MLGVNSRPVLAKVVRPQVRLKRPMLDIVPDDDVPGQVITMVVGAVWYKDCR